MGYFVSAIIISFCLYLIIRPFFNKEVNWQQGEIKYDLDNLTMEQIYATLNEIDMEYHMGKLPKDEFEKVKKQYERMAAQKLKEDTEGG